eukprot:TRINITY_DN11795_c0_g2_i1.p1 TRINITY_DN11795_c0_g2~~TRINITY_DN11795_c0_g2_i1.p1  ORF type:complete len:158 (-),score=20.15 TRINITY_DN11795_c0_g2_i1:252-725(-)
MASPQKLRRSTSAPEVRSKTEGQAQGQDGGSGYSDDDDDLLNGAMSGGEEFADRPVSMVICPTTGNLVQFSSQFFVTRLLGVLGVRVKRHRVLAISQVSVHTQPHCTCSLAQVDANSIIWCKEQHVCRPNNLESSARRTLAAAFARCHALLAVSHPR